MTHPVDVVSKSDEIIPVIIEAGSRTKKSIKHLKKGAGKLMAEVADILHEVQSEAKAGEKIVPVIIIYKEKAAKSTKGGISLPIPMPLNIFR